MTLKMKMRKAARKIFSNWGRDVALSEVSYHEGTKTSIDTILLNVYKYRGFK